MRLRTTISLLAAALAGAAAAPVAQASAASIGGFGARPAHFNPAVPATRAYFIHTVRRGGSFGDQVIVFNNGSSSLPVRVYPVDGLTGATSGAVYGNRQNRLVAAGRWVRTTESDATVPAHGHLPVGFSVQLPGDVTPGVHLAGLAVEVANPHSSGGRFSVTEVLRAVVGIEIKVPGPTHRAIALHGVALAAPGSSATAGLTVSLANVGGQLCKPQLSVALAGPGGSGRVIRQLDTVLPGDTIPYPVSWPRTLSEGKYSAVVTASGCGPARILNSSLAVGHELQALGGSASPRATVASATASGPVWWLFLLVGIGGIGIGGVAIGIVLARGRRQVTLEQH